MFRMIRQSWGQSVVAWGTFAATLGLAPRVDLGVIVGIALAVIVHLRREELITVTARHDNGILVLQPSGVLFFGSAPRLEQALLNDLATHPDTTVLQLDLARLGRVDYTGAITLLEFIRGAQDAALEVVVRRVPKHARGTLRRTWGAGTLQTLEGAER